MNNAIDKLLINHRNVKNYTSLPLVIQINLSNIKSINLIIFIKQR